jgi:plastocyanin
MDRNIDEGRLRTGRTAARSAGRRTSWSAGRIRRAALGAAAVSVLFGAAACASSGDGAATVGARASSPASSAPMSPGSMSAGSMSAGSIPPAPRPSGLTPSGPSSPASSGPSSPGSSSSVAATVTVNNFAFTPPTVTVPVGGSVEWKFIDVIQHTATAVDNSFDSGPMSNGQVFVHAFPKAGTYPYRCTIHPFMTGTVIVK